MDIATKINHQLSTKTIKYFSNIDRFCRASILFCAIVVIVVCAWMLDRGYEITDEAYYLLLAMYPDSVKLYISAQQWITSGIWQVTGSLFAFRAAGMLILIVSAVILAYGATVTCSHSKLKLSNEASRHALVLASSIICALLYGETINFSPCYNLLASASAYAAAGFILLGLHTQELWRRLGLLILAGGMLSVELVNKPSAGIATFCLMLIWILFFSKAPKNKFIDVATIVLSLVSGVLALIVTQANFHEVEFSINEGMQLFRMVQVESVGIRLVRYFSEFAGYSLDAIKTHIILISAVVLYLITRRMICVGATVVALVYTLATAQYITFSDNQYVLQMHYVTVIFVLSMLVSMPTLWKNSQFVALVTGLTLLPYTVAVGTGNSIFTQIIISLAPWGVTLSVIASLHFERKMDKVMLVILMTGLLVAITLQIMSSGLRDPYHMVQPLVSQSQRATIAGIGEVKVDADTSKFIADIEEAKEVCGIVPGAPFLGLYNLPGIALPLQAIPVLTPWLNNMAQAEAVLKLASPHVLHGSVIAVLLNADGGLPQLPLALSQLTQDFHYCGETIYPFHHQKIQLWYSRLGSSA